jgi:2-polyprenyl-6-hydroxyphenyl methylase/3-demethylubiquinone-9 3-methyltransferase
MPTAATGLNPLSRLNRLNRTVRTTARDLGIRAGVLPYRPLIWTADRWADSYTSGGTDAYGSLDELGRYGVLLGYLSWLGPGITVLDVGCGAGLLRARMAGVPFAAYLGVDPTPGAISQAEVLADERTTFRHADPLHDDLGQFDVVVCNEVLYFAREPERLVERVGAALRPGGHLLTSIWRHPGDTILWRWIDERYERLDRVSLRNPLNQFAPRGWRVACHRHRS